MVTGRPVAPRPEPSNKGESSPGAESGESAHEHSRYTRIPLLGETRTSHREERGQAGRPISTGKLNALLRLHRQPINLVVFQGTEGDDSFWRRLRA